MGITIAFHFAKNNFTLKLRYEVIFSVNKMLIAGKKKLLRNCFLNNCGDGEETLCLLRAVVPLRGAGGRPLGACGHTQAVLEEGKKENIDNPECHNDSLT